jgi:hypothetical protein
LQLQTTEAINSVTQQDWEGHCKQVAKLENQHWEKDCIMEGTVDKFIINTGDDSGEEQEFQTVDRNASEENETSVKSDNS